MEFHGTDTSSSTEFHGTRSAPISLTRWNSMELLLSAKLAHPKFHGIPWNCSCQRNWRILSSMEFHGIPWNFSCQRNWGTSSSMEFHGTARVSEIGALLVPWNCIELLLSAKLAHSKFHGIPWSSMELLMSAKLAHFKFHGIPWNSMELPVSAKLAQPTFHGIPWNFSCQRNWRTSSSMEFHGTARVSEIGAL